MFQKILDYPFKSGGMPFDISGFNNHGTPTAISFGFDGAESGSGFFSFNGSSSRVHVPYNDTWNDLIAVRVDALVRMDTVVKRQIIVEGNYSFSLYVRRDGTVGAACLGFKEADDDLQPSNAFAISVLGGGGSPDPFDTEAAAPTPSGQGVDIEWIGVNTTSEFAPDSVGRTLTPGQWARILFVHDGVSMQIYLNGVLAGYRDDVQAPVLGVQAAGVHVGGHPLGPNLRWNAMQGSMDHLRIWKFDPYARQRRFFCRKMEPHTEACWHDLFAAIIRARKDEKTRADMEEALICVQKAEEKLIRGIQAQGQPAMQQAARFARQYQELWCKGELDGEKMKRLITDWVAWMSEATGSTFSNYLAGVMACLPVLQKAMPEKVAARFKTCDPAFRAFLGSLCEVGPGTPGRSPPYGGGDKGGGTYPQDQDEGTAKPDYRQRRDNRDDRHPASGDKPEY